MKTAREAKMLNVAHFYQLTVAAMALQLDSNLLPLITKFNRSVKCRSTGLTRPSVQTLGAARDEPSHSSLFLLAADRPAGDANFFFFLFFASLFFVLWRSRAAGRDLRVCCSENKRRTIGCDLLPLPEVHSTKKIQSEKEKECGRRGKLRVLATHGGHPQSGVRHEGLDAALLLLVCGAVQARAFS